MAVQPNYPAATPSLLLDFANNKRLDPRITFTRTTTATYYDGATTAKAEENLVTYSQEFDNAAWAKVNASITANSTTAPDGTSTADSFVRSGTVESVVAVNTFSSSANTYVVSVFAKASTQNFLFIQVNINSAAAASFITFDLTTGSAGTQQNLVSSVTLTASSVSVGSGWYRCIVSYTGGSTNSQVLFGAASAANVRSGTDGGVIFLWGAQLEQRSSVTAYTATTTQPITNYIPVLQIAAAGQARFDHNPTTDESLGLLVEEARTNLFLRSEEFDNAYWIKSGATVTGNNVVAPNGTLTADTLVAPASPGYGSIYISISLTATQYTMSVFAKGSVTIYMYLATSGFGIGGWGEYNLSTGQVTKITNFGATTGSTASITPVGNGWYRCSLTVLCTATTYVPIIGTYVPSAVIWGAQLEAGAFPTSYIPTVAAQVTRNADVANIAGNNFTSWYNQGEGAIYTELSSLSPLTLSQSIALGKYPAVFHFDSGTTDTTLSWYGIEAALDVGATFNSLGSVLTGNNKSAVSFSTTSGQAALSLNGAAAVSRNGALTGTATRLGIGSNLDFLSGSCLNGTIKKLAYYPLRLTNAQLQALTS